MLINELNSIKKAEMSNTPVVYKVLSNGVVIVTMPDKSRHALANQEYADNFIQNWIKKNHNNN